MMRTAYVTVYATEPERNEGIALGKSDDLLSIFGSLGVIQIQLKYKIVKERDETLFKKRVLSAAHSKRIDEYRKNTGL